MTYTRYLHVTFYTPGVEKTRRQEVYLYHTEKKTLAKDCLVPVRRLSRPSRSMHFGDVSETNGRETPRQSRSAHA